MLEPTLLNIVAFATLAVVVFLGHNKLSQKERADFLKAADETGKVIVAFDEAFRLIEKEVWGKMLYAFDQLATMKEFQDKFKAIKDQYWYLCAARPFFFTGYSELVEQLQKLAKECLELDYSVYQEGKLKDSE